MKKILTIGGATQDIFLHYEGADFISITKKSETLHYLLFESGEKIEVDKILYHTGGGATNSAVSFKRLGFDVSCFCKIGSDSAGSHILKELKKEKIDTKNIILSKKIESGSSFIINSLKKERTILAYRGANGFLQESEISETKIEKFDQIYITSLSYNSVKILPKILTIAQKNKIPVAINPGISQLSKGASVLKDCLKYIDILILNSSEAKTFMFALSENNKNYQKAFECEQAILTNIDKKEEQPYLIECPVMYENIYFSTTKFFKEVLKMGPKIVVITNGNNGVYVATKNEILFHPSIKTEVIDTVGAGDAFGSCFVASLNLGYDIKQALQNGIINSSSVINKIGAKPGLLTKKELLNKIKIISKDYKVQKIKIKL